MKWKFSFLFTSIITIANYCLAQNFDSTQESSQLFYEAFNSNSASKKITIFAYLKKKVEKKTYSLFASAFLNEYNDSLDKAKLQYNLCLKNYPNFLPALYQLASLEEDDAKSLTIKKRIISEDFSFKNYSVLTDIFFEYINQSKEDSAFNFLNRVHASTSNSFIYDYIKGKYYYNKRDAIKANDFINKALKIDSTYEPLLILKSQYDLVYKENEDFFYSIYEKFILNPKLESLGEYIVDMFSNSGSLNNRNDNLETIFSGTIDSVSSTYIPLLILNKYSKLNREYTIEEFSSFLKLNQRFPNDHNVLARISAGYFTLFADTINATTYMNKAIENSYTLKDSIINIEMLTTFSLTNKNSFENIESILNKNTDVKGQNLLYEKYKIDLYKLRPSFNAALDNLTKFITRKEIADRNEIFGNGLIQVDKRELQNLINEKTVSDSLYAHNNILNSWKQLFGNLVNISLSFEENSSTHNSKNDSIFKLLGKFIITTKADNCVFLVEGHVAVGEANSDALSLDRAKTIAKYFSENFGILPKNLRIKSFGDKFPIASNILKGERFKNMRVDISPYWIFTEPKVLATSALIANKTIAISPDGNYIVTGTSPMQLWDLKLKILLKEFGVGSDQVKFSPDGRFIAAIANSEIKDNLLQSSLSIYDIKTGLLYDKIPWSNRIEDFDWNPFSTEIAMITSNGFIIVYDLSTKQKSNLRKIRFDGKIPKCIIWTKDNKYLINGYATKTNLSVWDSDNIQLVKELQGTYWPHALQQSNDGNFLFCASNNRFLSIWDLKTWNLEHMPIPVLAGQIIVHPYRNEILLNDWGAGNRNMMTLVDFTKKKIINKKIVYDEGINYAYSPNGDLIFQALKDTIKILDSETLEQKSSIIGMSYKALGCKSDTANNLFLTYDSYGIHAIDITSGLERFNWNIKAKILKEVYGTSNRYIVTAEKDSLTEVYSLDSKTFERKLITTVKSQIDLIESNNKYWVFACKRFTRPNLGNTNGFLDIRDTGLKTIRIIDVPIVTRRLEEEGLTGSGFLNLALSPSQTVSFTTYWLDGFKKGIKLSKLINSYNLLNGRKTDSLSVNSEISRVLYLDSNKLLLTSLSGSYEYNSHSKTIKYFSNLLPEQHSLANKSESLQLIWSNNFIRISKNQKPIKELFFPNNLIGVQLFERQNIFITLTTSNKASFYDLDSFKERLTLVSKKDNEWIAYTPQGNFQASLFGAENVFWSYGDDYIEFSQLKNENENVNLMRRQLAAIKNKERLADPGVKKAIEKQFEISKGFRIISSKQLKTDNSRYDLELLFDKTQLNGASIAGWEIEIEYRKSYSNPITEVIHLGTLLANKDSVYFERSYELEDGFNLLKLTLYSSKQKNEDQNYRDYVEITKLPKVERKKEKNLYFLGIAVDNYKDSSMLLKYPVKDARAIARLLMRQKGIYYQAVDTVLVLNDDLDNLCRKMTVFLNQINANKNDSDIVIVYVSGHGKQDGKHLTLLQNYVSSTDQITEGIYDITLFSPLLKLEHLSRDNKILFMDMCSSGSGYSPPDDKGVIFPSCWAAESSYEDSVDGEGHGLFTAALIEALRGKADREKMPELDSLPGRNGNEDGFIDLHELTSYISRRVQLLSNKIQHPISPPITKDYFLIKLIND